MEKLLLGGYTRRDNKGISSVLLNTEMKKLENVKREAVIESPTYLATVGDFVFSIAKEDEWAGIALYENTADGLQEVATAMTQGVNPPCYVSFDTKRQLAFNANYHQGFFQVIKIDDEGLDIVNDVQHDGSSVHDNQQGPHVHYVQVDKKSEYLLVCDLGTDGVYVYDVDNDGGVELHSRYATKAGFGPRHLVEHPTQPLIYIIGELSNEIDVCRYENGELTFVDRVSLLPEGYTEWSGAAAIRISNDGKFVYASNRGHDSITVFEVQENGTLKAIQWVATEGKTPRDFNFNQTQDFIICGHQDDDVLSLFERNKETGLLTLCDKTAVAHECVCVTPLSR